MIVCAPASSMGWDYNWQLLQGTGVVPFSNHHPVLGSLIYGYLYKIGFIICGAYGGLFFTGIFQVALMSFAMAYGISSVRRMGVENNSDLEGIFYVKSSFPNARSSLIKFLGIWKKLPLLQLVFVPAFYYLISLLSMGYLFIRKRAVFWQCMPIMVIVIINCFSPVNGYMRYFLPVALSSLLMIGLCFTGKENSFDYSIGYNYL